MKSNMQIINVNGAIFYVVLKMGFLFFYFSIGGNVNLYFIKLASDMIH